MKVGAADLSELARGCALLGAGGGGDPELATVMARRALDRNGDLTVVSVEDLDPDALIVPCGLIGAPTVALERIWNGDEAAILVARIEGIWQRKVTALMPYEVGGSNGMLPVTWASNLGLPLVDA